MDLNTTWAPLRKSNSLWEKERSEVSPQKFNSSTTTRSKMKLRATSHSSRSMLTMMLMIWASWHLFQKWKWVMCTMRVLTSLKETWWFLNTSCRSRVRRLSRLSKPNRIISSTWKQTCKLLTKSMSSLRQTKKLKTTLPNWCQRKAWTILTNQIFIGSASQISRSRVLRRKKALKRGSLLTNSINLICSNPTL